MSKIHAGVVALGTALLLAGCIQPPRPTPTTTTTTTSSTTTTTGAPAGPAAGCYDSFVDTADFTYSGTPDVIGNMTLHNSGDGSCTGIHGDPHVLTLVYSPGSSAHASQFCTANGLESPQPLDARSSTYDFRLDGVTIGPDAYLCVQPLSPTTTTTTSTTTTTTTTTVPGFTPIAVGCHDGLGSDLYFTGPIDTVGDAVIHQTLDGSCGHAVAPRTLVQAADHAGAVQRCQAIGLTDATAKPLDDPSFGYTTLHSAWECW